MEYDVPAEIRDRMAQENDEPAHTAIRLGDQVQLAVSDHGNIYLMVDREVFLYRWDG